MDITKMTIGKKLILAGGAVGIISLFFPWVDAGIISANGFQQQGYLLILAFIYPIFSIVLRRQLKFIRSLISLFIGVAIMFAFIESKSTNLFGTDVNMAASGMYIMICAFIISIIGIIFEKNSIKKSN